MNKTLVFAGIALIAALGLIGVVILMLNKVDATPFIAMFGTMLPIVITAAVTIDGLAKIKEQAEATQAVAVRTAKSVNGNTTALIELASKNNLTYEEQEIIARAENDNRDLADTIAGGKHVAV